ncbi:DEAD/DEAH box helicase [Paenibacillus hamazuiensis]|uniref:DEAD/DEAH box helicase n=1 Tax=Paenibacillus hamazuiensis TaxID=2936508 RepID=UPI003B84B0F5
MIDLSTMTVHARWIASGSFFLWGTRQSGGIWDAMDLKNILFAWHKPSFYGTFLETTDWFQKEGVLLPALEALDYFCDPAHAQHMKLEWDAEAAALLSTAPAVKEALLAGRFMPDFAQWKAGTRGWKLQLPADAGGAEEPIVQEWIAHLIPQWVERDGRMKENLQQLERAFPLLQRESTSSDIWMDEEDWLVSIGWQADATPYRSCLQLVEPQGGDLLWRLRFVLQDRANPDIVFVVNEHGEPVEDRALPDDWPLDRLAKDIAKWGRIVPWLRRDDGEGLRTQLTSDEAWDFLAEDSLRLIEAGYTIFLPAWWERIRRTRPKLKARIKSSVGAAGTALFGLEALMRFDWKIAVGDMELTEEEFRQLLAEKRKLVQLRGAWVQLDPTQLARIEQAMKQVEKKRGLSFRDVLELHLLGSVDGEEELDFERTLPIEVELNEHLEDMIGQLMHSKRPPSITPPDSFRGSLRPYQTEGISWMYFLRRTGLGGCLADDMGLGKTIQWISYLLYVQEHEKPGLPSLLICPTSVLGNWQKELQRFAPHLKVHLHYGPNRAKGKKFTEACEGMHLVLTSYTLAHLDETELSSVEWDSICLDEAQNIKNAYTKQAQSIRQLSGRHRIAMTGTPMENRLTELWSIFDFINPGYLGSLRDFSQRYVNAVERTQDPELIGKVQRLIRPFLLRRVKNDPSIQLDLPEKNEYKTFVSLTAEQATLYESEVQNLLQRIDRLSAMERRGHILASLTKLKQVCNHPSLLLKENFSRPWQNRSNKVERLLEMVQELRQEGDRCLVFTQFVETGLLLQHIFRQELGLEVPFLNGSTPRITRDEMIAHFQDEASDHPGIFLLSLKAGGIGLNLTAANHVFHFDRWWNPAVENQATDRAFRIGQTRHVQVHKFVTLGTLEERIDEMIERKQGLSQQIVGTGENWITELSTDDLRELFILRNEWVET